MSVTAKCLINSQFAPAAAALLYLCPAGVKNTIIDKFTATNTDGSTQSVTVYLVPFGGVFDSSNLIIDALSISTLVTADITALQNQILNTGDSIYVLASAGTKVNVRASGREVA